MAFRASNIIPQTAYSEAKGLALKIKTVVQGWSTKFTSSGGNANEIYAVLEQLRSYKARLDTIKGAPGIAAYAISQESDANYDVVTEFNTLVAALNTAITWLEENIPVYNGYDLMFQRVAGALVPRTFTAVSLSVLITRLDAIYNQVS